MKKVLVFCLVMVMMLNLSIIAFAAPSGFVASPGANKAPEIVGSEVVGGGTPSQIKVTSYAERESLSDELKKEIEKAYDDIINAKDISKLNVDLAKVVEDNGIDISDLAISDLFKVEFTDGNADGKSHIITLSAENLENFVGLMFLNSNGEWEYVKDAKIVNGGKNIQFTANSTSPYVIVVNKGEKESPKTGDNSNMVVYLAVMAVSAAAIVFLKKAKKFA